MVSTNLLVQSRRIHESSAGSNVFVKSFPTLSNLNIPVETICGHIWCINVGIPTFLFATGRCESFTISQTFRLTRSLSLSYMKQTCIICKISGWAISYLFWRNYVQHCLLLQLKYLKRFSRYLNFTFCTNTSSENIVVEKE